MCSNERRRQRLICPYSTPESKRTVKEKKDLFLFLFSSRTILFLLVGRYITHCARGSDDDTTWTPIAVGVRMKDEARD